jgi:polyhydroxybutyrate depolymerase
MWRASRFRCLTLAFAVLAVAGRVSLAAAAEVEGQFEHDGLLRRYELHTPPSPGTVPLPLVVVLHGGGSGDNPIGMIRQLTGFDRKADTARFAVVYPEAIEHYWNDGRDLRTYRSQSEQIDDVGFIAAVVDHVAGRIALDRQRVYVTGASNGAMMAYRVGCERPELVAAIAGVAGNLPVRLSCAPQRAVPVLVMNGTSDPLMPWNGGDVRFGSQRLGVVHSAQETIARWVAHNQCGRTARVEPLANRSPRDGTRVYRESYSACADNVSVVLYRVQAGGHTWPGGPQLTSRLIVGRTSEDINATDVIWTFFSAYTRTLE